MRNDTVERTLVVREPPRLTEIAPLERTGTLTVLVGADVGAVFSLQADTINIGRSPEAGITLEDDGISRNHARIRRVDEHYELEDLGSTNGTYLGNTRVSAAVRIDDGARIQLGNTLLRFALQDTIEREAGKRIYEMSVRDGLTGVFNRRYFEERLAAEFAFAARHGSALCVLLCDVDHFKRVNDTFGHQAGDMVLRRVAEELRKGVRTEDVVARYGGEEFAVLARGIDVVGARMFAERVRLMAERAQIEWEGRQISITISIGFAHNHAGAAVSRAERLVSAADQALYAAKRLGRNRAELAASPGRYSAGGSGEEPAESSHQAEPKEARTKLRRRIWEQTTTPSDEHGKALKGDPSKGAHKPRRS